MASFLKRKRNPRDVRCVAFPKDVSEAFVRRGTCESSWERCGDSFLDTSGMEKRDSSRQTSRAVRQTAQTSVSARSSSGDDDPIHIAWTSSDEEQSDGEHQIPLAIDKAARRSGPKLSTYRHFVDTGADTDDLPTIDSESEHEDISTSKEQISLISDYSSDSDGDADPSRPDSPAREPAEQQQRTISEWVRSAQALLQTPQKQTDKPSKTPEDSGKKKRKFESGGLAERLNRLQCRQRSAVSFWRHQPVSGIITGTEERPGVLAIRVESVQEVCGMQAALCHRHPDRETCVALFNKETAAQLAPGTGDIIHVYPPWQSLSVDGESHPIILNTHFSQKVLSASNPVTCSNVLKEKTKPYPLTRCLWRTQEDFKSSQASVPVRKTGQDAGSAFDSLLEALDASGSVCGPVEAVVQRIYFDCVAQLPHASLVRHRALSRCRSGPAQQQHVSRCCLLVQDVYGMFSEVETQRTSSEAELNDFAKQILGKSCLLQGLKVIQRLTRDRCAQLFSLIDSLWPPAVPLRVPGESSSCRTVKVSAPSFCYRLAGQRDCVFPKCESPLYCPPVTRTLREILQDEPTGRRCSFKATLVYKRDQGKEEKDLLLFVTDSSLQDEHNPGTISRTVPVYISRVLESTAHQAVSALTPKFRPSLMFRDALIDQGKIIITGQSVVQPDSQHDSVSLTQGVLLDPLTPHSPPCSLCTVTGVVTDIDESSAFSWPVCGQCSGDGLESFKDEHDVFSCLACGFVGKAERRLQLEVFLICPSTSHCTVKVKLQQHSIVSLLNSTAHSEGYEAEAVLGKTVGPLDAFVHAVSRSSVLWMGLEEITL